MGMYFEFVSDNRFATVMQYAKTHDFFTSAEAAKALNMPYIGNYLSRLCKQGYVGFTYRKNRLGQMIRVYYFKKQ